MAVYHTSAGGKAPAWGAPTAPTNFCEEDYHISSWIAEFINTLSSLGYVYYGLCGLLNNHDRRPYLDFNLQYMALIFVGVASALFHASLKESLMLLDQFSMFFGTAVVLHRLETIRHEERKMILGVGLTALLVIVWVGQTVFAEPAFHWVTFLVMLAFIWRRVVGFIRMEVRDEVMAKKLRGLARKGFVGFVSGLGVWLVDAYCCQQLRAMRRQVSHPLGFLLELHGWWHILTAIGVYQYMVLAETIHLVCKGKRFDLKRLAPGFLHVTVVADAQEKDHGYKKRE